MKVTVGTTPELKALYGDEEDLMRYLDKVNHQLAVDPRNMEYRSMQLGARHELAIIQHRIDTLNTQLKEGR